MTMNVFTKNIKRLMGWCPNAKALETGSQTVPANFEIYDKSGGEKAGNNPSRTRRIGLSLTSIGAFVLALTLILEIRVVSTKDEILVSSLMTGLGTLLLLTGAALYIKG